MKDKSFIMLATCQSKHSCSSVCLYICVSFDTSIMPQSLVVNMYTTCFVIRGTVFSSRYVFYSYVSSGSLISTDYFAMATATLIHSSGSCNWDVAVFGQVHNASLNTFRTHVMLQTVNVGIKFGTELSADSATVIKTHLRGNKIGIAHIM